MKTCLYYVKNISDNILFYKSLTLINPSFLNQNTNAQLFKTGILTQFLVLYNLLAKRWRQIIDWWIVLDTANFLSQNSYERNFNSWKVYFRPRTLSHDFNWCVVQLNWMKNGHTIPQSGQMRISTYLTSVFHAIWKFCNVRCGYVISTRFSVWFSMFFSNSFSA